MIVELFHDLEPLIREYGLPALFLLLVLESVGLPLPGETALILTGTLAGRGELPLPAVLLTAWAGAVAGDNLGFLIGRRAGRPLALRHGGKVGITPARLAWVEGVFARYGPLAVAFARFFNGLRQLNGFVAGMSGMDWRIFAPCNAAGSLLWVLTWGLGAWWVSSHAERIAALKQWAASAESTLLPGLGLLLLVAILLLWRRRHTSRQKPAGGLDRGPPRV
ncbi:MAG: DedA family protein [Parvibaculaceae bacterium]